MDVGAGAGFPGLPLAIALPDLRVTLLEATGKKVRFLGQTILELGLENVSAVYGRAEEYAREPKQRGREHQQIEGMVELRGEDVQLQDVRVPEARPVGRRHHEACQHEQKQCEGDAPVQRFDYAVPASGKRVRR